MNSMQIHFSTGRDSWETPNEFFDRLNAVIGFDLDVCANPLNNKLPKYYTESNSAFSHEWFGNCWMNPPYSRKLQKEFLNYAVEQVNTNECTVTGLAAARTDTKNYHEIIVPNADVICYIKGRLKFIETVMTETEFTKVTSDAAPFPSMLFYMSHSKSSEEIERVKELFSTFGDVRVNINR